MVRRPRCEADRRKGYIAISTFRRKRRKETKDDGKDQDHLRGGVELELKKIDVGKETLDLWREVLAWFELGGPEKVKSGLRARIQVVARRVEP